MNKEHRFANVEDIQTYVMIMNFTLKIKIQHSLFDIQDDVTHYMLSLVTDLLDRLI